MGETTGISWTDHTFNPWIGCTKVSAGCDNCYAEQLMDKRYKKVNWGHGNPRARTSVPNWNMPLAWNRAAEAEGRRHRVFCSSLADIFDNEVPVEWLRDVLELIRLTPWLDWQLLTKRPARITRALDSVHALCLGDVTDRYDPLIIMLRHWTEDEVPPRNVWLGTSVENQDAALARIGDLLNVPAAVHFLSCEPLLGPIDLAEILSLEYEAQESRSAFWVIVGGESGSNARPMHPDWARSLHEQCTTAGVPFFFKQWGEWAPGIRIHGDMLCFVNQDGSWEAQPYPGKVLSGRGAAIMEHVGKHAAGDLLDGVQYHAFPEVR